MENKRTRFSSLASILASYCSHRTPSRSWCMSPARPTADCSVASSMRATKGGVTYVPKGGGFRLEKKEILSAKNCVARARDREEQGARERRARENRRGPASWTVRDSKRRADGGWRRVIHRCNHRVEHFFKQKNTRCSRKTACSGTTARVGSMPMPQRHRDDAGEGTR